MIAVPSLRANAIDAFEKRQTELRPSVKLTVLVCGPSVVDENGRESAKPSAQVRRYVSEMMEQEGHCPVWGEHLTPPGPGGKNQWIRRFNNADKEILFAVDVRTDLVVVLPDSAGSLAELGAFCTHKDVSAKLLVIFHKQYKDKRSFVCRALAKAARSRKATIRFRDYADPSAVWKEVRKVLEETQRVKAVDLTHARD